MYYIYFVYRNIGNRNTVGIPPSNDWSSSDMTLSTRPANKGMKISNDSILSTIRVEDQHLRIYQSCSLSAVFRIFNVLYLYITWCVLHTLFHWNGVVEVSTRELRKLAGETGTHWGATSSISRPTAPWPLLMIRFELIATIRIRSDLGFREKLTTNF